MSTPEGPAVPFWKKKEEEPEESQAERLRKFRNMYSVQYGTAPPQPFKEVGEPIKVQTLCTICSEPMEARDGGHLACPAAESEPVLHEHLRVALQNWRGGQVQGKVVPQYNKTIGLMRQALKNALARDREAAAAERAREATGKPAGGLPPPVTPRSG